MKRVNSHQSKFIDAGMDEDDDFAQPTSAHSAKQRKKGKTKSQPSTQPTSKTSESKRPKKIRLPPEDKLYERELQLALELSVEEATKSQSSSSSQEQSVSDEFISDSPRANHNSPPCLDRVAPLSINEVTESNDAPNLKSEVFQVVSESENVTEEKPKGRGVKRPKYAESSSGSDDESVVPSSDNMSDDSDDSFSCRKSTKRSKKTVREQKRGKTKSPVKHKNSIKPHSDVPVLQQEKHDVSRTDCKPLVERTNTAIKELGTCQKSSPALLRSPINGTIRLGLSKKARVKPLHPLVNIVQRN